MTAEELFNATFNAALVVMLLTLIWALGMTFSFKQILEPLRRVWHARSTGKSTATAPAPDPSPATATSGQAT